jgi:4-hydroxy-tetrahydrodipicolinate synthase
MQLSKINLWTALVTPLNPDLSVDFSSLKKLIVEQENAKNGLLILGSTAEALNLDLEVKKSIVKFAVELKPSQPIMVGVGGHQLTETLNWIAFLETQPISSYLLVTPMYAKPGDHGQIHWFKTLMDKSTKPCILYNVPSRTGVSLSLKAISELKSHMNFFGIKEASGSVEKFKQYVEAAKVNNHSRVFCGDDSLMPDFAAHGSCGLISVASNVWPQETHLYVEQCLNKKFDAKELWEKASNSLFIASNPVPAKAILHAQNRISHKTMMPPLHASDLADISEIQLACDNISRWYSSQK